MNSACSDPSPTSSSSSTSAPAGSIRRRSIWTVSTRRAIARRRTVGGRGPHHVDPCGPGDPTPGHTRVAAKLTRFRAGRRSASVPSRSISHRYGGGVISSAAIAHSNIRMTRRQTKAVPPGCTLAGGAPRVRLWPPQQASPGNTGPPCASTRGVPTPRRAECATAAPKRLVQRLSLPAGQRRRWGIPALAAVSGQQQRPYAGVSTYGLPLRGTGTPNLHDRQMLTRTTSRSLGAVTGSHDLHDRSRSPSGRRVRAAGKDLPASAAVSELMAAVAPVEVARRASSCADRSSTGCGRPC